MENNYEVVPNIISSKDLDYLSDIFTWNYNSYKCTYNSLENISDEEIKEMEERVANMFHNNMSNILTIMEEAQNGE